MWNCTLIPSVQNSCYIIYKGFVFNYSMQNVLSAVGWCIHTPCCVLYFFPGTHPGKSNPQWGTSSSCSIYTVLNFPGILSAGAIWQGNFFIAQNTFSCQWRCSVWGWVWCFRLVCSMELLMLNHTLTSTGHWNYLPSLGNFILNYSRSSK